MRLGAFALLLALLPGIAFADGGWLDAGDTPAWNLAGGAVPHALPENPDPRGICPRQERPPTTPDEQQLAAQGWKLESYWPARQQGDVVLLLALSSYDGMCRPWGFNAFVFAGGRFAGTLSPQPMNSRADGVLASQPC